MMNKETRQYKLVWYAEKEVEKEKEAKSGALIPTSSVVSHLFFLVRSTPILVRVIAPG